MCDSHIDENSIMTYLSQFPKAILNQNVAGSQQHLALYSILLTYHRRHHICVREGGLGLGGFTPPIRALKKFRAIIKIRVDMLYAVCFIRVSNLLSNQSINQSINQSVNQYHCHCIVSKCQFFPAKMHKIQFRLSSATDPRWGNLQRFPGLVAAVAGARCKKSAPKPTLDRPFVTGPY